MSDKISNMEDAFKWIEGLSDEEQMIFFKCEILKILNIDEYEIKYILDDIKTSCEYVAVYFALKSHNFFYQNKPSTYGQQRNDLKKKIENTKTRIIDDLKFLYKESTLKYDGKLIQKFILETSDIEVDEHQYSNSHKEPALKGSKQMLFETLVLDCNTGNRRAKALTKILEYI